jgi:hypothetical protein
MAKEGKTVPKPARPRLPNGRYVKTSPNGDVTYAPLPPDGTDGHLPWIKQAACRDVDTEIFYTTNTKREAEALAYCNGDDDAGIRVCPVKTECLLYALTVNDRSSHKTDAIMGGMTEKERDKLAKKAAANGRVEVAV